MIQHVDHEAFLPLVAAAGETVLCHGGVFSRVAVTLRLRAVSLRKRTLINSSDDIRRLHAPDNI